MNTQEKSFFFKFSLDKRTESRFKYGWSHVKSGPRLRWQFHDAITHVILKLTVRLSVQILSQTRHDPSNLLLTLAETVGPSQL